LVKQQRHAEEAVLGPAVAFRCDGESWRERQLAHVSEALEQFAQVCC